MNRKIGRSQIEILLKRKTYISEHELFEMMRSRDVYQIHSELRRQLECTIKSIQQAQKMNEASFATQKALILKKKETLDKEKQKLKNVVELLGYDVLPFKTKSIKEKQDSEIAIRDMIKTESEKRAKKLEVIEPEMIENKVEININEQAEDKLPPINLTNSKLFISAKKEQTTLDEKQNRIGEKERVQADEKQISWSDSFNREKESTEENNEKRRTKLPRVPARENSNLLDSRDLNTEDNKNKFTMNHSPISRGDTKLSHSSFKHEPRKHSEIIRAKTFSGIRRKSLHGNKNKTGSTPVLEKRERTITMIFMEEENENLRPPSAFDVEAWLIYNKTKRGYSIILDPKEQDNSDQNENPKPEKTKLKVQFQTRSKEGTVKEKPNEILKCPRKRRQEWYVKFLESKNRRRRKSDAMKRNEMKDLYETKRMSLPCLDNSKSLIGEKQGEMRLSLSDSCDNSKLLNQLKIRNKALGEKVQHFMTI